MGISTSDTLLVHGRPLNLFGCVKLVHELSKQLLKSIIYVFMSFRPNLLLTPWTPSSRIVISPSRTSNKSAPSPNYSPSVPVCSCSSAEGGEGIEGAAAGGLVASWGCPC